MVTLTFRTQPAKISSEGRFSGYGAVFGNVDSHRDVIERGAFATTLKEWEAKGRMPTMCLQHGSAGNPFRHDDLPIGRWTLMQEDAFGLFVEGQLLVLDTDQGARIKGLMAGGVLDGLSIGFNIRKSRPGDGKIKRYITDIDLQEISIVDRPSNDKARVAQLTPADAAADKLRAALEAASAAEAKPKSVEDPTDRLLVALRQATAEANG